MKFKIKPLYINIALAALVLFLGAINLLVYVDPETRNPVLLDGMQTSEAYDTQEKPSSGAMVVEGTVPFGQTPYRYGSGPIESERAGKDLSNPLKPTPANLARGKVIYDRFCMTCHVSKTGDDPRPVVKRGVPNSPALITERVKGFADGYIFNYVTKGGAIMPAYGPQIMEEDRWKLVLYMRDALSKEVK